MMMKGVFLVLVAFGATLATCQTQRTNVCEMIMNHGMPCVDETTPPTEDGWILTVQHIPAKVSPPTGVVFWQHGLLDTAIGVNLYPPPNSLPWMLYEAGYDIWFGNNRGNSISMDNIHFSSDQTGFWAWSFDEMGKYDLPTQISYVLSQTGAPTLSYIGHSQGTAQAFIGFCNKTVADMVDIFIAFAPVAYIGHTESLLMKATSLFNTYELDLLLGLDEYSLPAAVEAIMPDYCTLFPSFCLYEMDLMMGVSININDTMMAYFTKYDPNTVSVQDMIHWAQAVNTDTWQMYDYGPIGNEQKYGQLTPPKYNLTALPADLPIALFTGGMDALADPVDVAKLISLLPTSPYVHNEPTYAHMDFIWGADSMNLIFPDVLAQLKVAKQSPKAKGIKSQ